MSFNYHDKMNYRKQLMLNINQNYTNTQNLDIKQWYEKYMPFLPKEVLDILPQLEKEKQKINNMEESLPYLKILFKE